MPKAKAVKKLGATKTPKKTSKYHIEVLVNDADYKGTADTLAGAIKGFIESSAFPVVIKSRVLFRFGTKDKQTQRNYPPQMARRILNMATYKDSAVEMLANRFERDLNELA